VMNALGAADARVVVCGEDYLSPPAAVVIARRKESQPVRRRSARAGRRSG
jgi:16S rRNA (guanine527-N7)-methyltransferase